jgi:hypothetical protein
VTYDQRLTHPAFAPWLKSAEGTRIPLRSDESLGDKWLYVEENPVRAGLVKRWQDWPYRYEFNSDKL